MNDITEANITVLCIAYKAGYIATITDTTYKAYAHDNKQLYNNGTNVFSNFYEARNAIIEEFERSMVYERTRKN